MIIQFNKKHILFLKDKTKKEFPIEICGFVLGSVKNRKIKVEKLVNAKNILESSERFQINPIEFLNVLSQANKLNIEHIGFFHSHHMAPIPSQLDLKYMLFWPGKIWVIISSINYTLTAFKASNDRIQKIRIKVRKI